MVNLPLKLKSNIGMAMLAFNMLDYQHNHRLMKLINKQYLLLWSDYCLKLQFAIIIIIRGMSLGSTS